MQFTEELHWLKREVTRLTCKVNALQMCCENFWTALNFEYISFDSLTTDTIPIYTDKFPMSDFNSDIIVLLNGLRLKHSVNAPLSNEYTTEIGIGGVDPFVNIILSVALEYEDVLEVWYRKKDIVPFV